MSLFQDLDTEAFDAPFFRACKDGCRITIDGSACHSFGHVVQAEIGSDADPFASWAWDGRQLTVRNDRYGFFPLFYYEHLNEFAISPSLIKLLLLGAPTELDYPALAVFLRTESFLGEDTPFRAIRRVPPGTSMAWDHDGLRMSGQYLIGKPREISRDAAMEGHIELFRMAVRRRPPEGASVVPLSGGRDSRHILLELCANGNPPDAAVTIRYEPTVVTTDVEVAAALAVATGVRHVVLDVPPLGAVAREWHKNVVTHLCALEHAWTMPMAEFIADHFATAYEGVAGDLLSTTWSSSPEVDRWFEAGDFARLANNMLTDGWLPNVVRSAEYRSLSHEVAQARLAEELRRHSNAANPFGSFYFWNRARRTTGVLPTCILGRKLKVWCPYLDRDFFDFMSTIPSHVLRGPEYHSFHTEAIQRAFPRYAHIPFAAKAPWFRRDVPFCRRVIRDTLRLFADLPRSRLLRRSSGLVRMLRGLIDPGYAFDGANVSRFCLYIAQLESYRAGAVRHG